MKTLSEIVRIKEALETELLKRPGVTGVDVGYKYVGGVKTDQISIRVLVENKKDVPQKEKIPAKLEGVITDVIQRKFVLQPLMIKLDDLVLMADTGRYDPVKGGISIGPCRAIYLSPPDVPTPGYYVFTGTLGAIVRDNTTNNPMLLSNFHVMCVDDKWKVGDTMAQPSRVDTGKCPADVVGSLQRASLGGQVDCAVSSLSGRGYICEIMEIGSVTGTATAVLGEAVRKRGRTTGLTYGTVDSVSLTVTVPYGNGLGNQTLTNQIGIEVDPAHSAKFGDQGDSGSVVVNQKRQVIGLHFAGSEDGKSGVANPIQAVLSALDVKICTKIIKKIEKLEKKEILKYEKIEKKEFKELKFEKNVLKEQTKSEFEKYPDVPPKDMVEGPGEIMPGQPMAEPSPKKSEYEKHWKSEHKEWKEFKEREKPFRKEAKDFKDMREFYSPVEIPIPPEVMPRGGMEDRLSRIEAAVTQLSHFISSELRPDLSAGALSQEPDLQEMSQQLQKEETDAKQYKDHKDCEKLSER